MATSARARLIGRRLVQFVPIVILATLIVFGLLQLVPGDPAIALAGENASPQRIEEIRHTYGFDQPFLVQYGRWLFHAAQGDLSRSLLSREQVRVEILQNFPNTLLVVVLALGLALLIGIPLGITAAVRAGSAADSVISGIASLGVALPNFWLAMILVAIFALDLHWLPATGATPLGENAGEALRHALLPAAAVAAGAIATVTRQLRSALLEVLSSQYVRTLYAKGLSPTAILWKHGLKNVSVNLLTVVALLFNQLLGATVVVEAVFAIPGMGSLIVNAVINKDFPVVQGVVFTLVIVVILTNLLTDILYTLLDPRVGRA